MYKILLFLTIILTIVGAFDKNSLRKEKVSFDKKPQHPISRRVLRYERSLSENFDELGLPYASHDFAKVLPDRQLKSKGSNKLFSENSESDF